MEWIDKRYQVAQQALATLKTALDKFHDMDINHIYYQEVRDSIIQRFEYSTDTFWKYIKDYLAKIMV